MKKDQLPVSRKFYNDISTRVGNALAAAPASAAEAMRIIDAYMAGKEPVSRDSMSLLAFNMVKAEIDRAMARSQRARERAKARKSMTKKEATGTGKTTPPQATSTIRQNRKKDRALKRRLRKAGPTIQTAHSSIAATRLSPEMKRSASSRVL